MGVPNKKAILVVSFGTSYNDNRERTIGAVEREIAGAFPDFTVKRAFTSQFIIDKLKARDGLIIAGVDEAMQDLAEQGCEVLIVLPTHVMNGIEYDEMVAHVMAYRTLFKSLALGRPVLGAREDFAEVIEILTEVTSEYNCENTSIVFMGHGTDHEANAIYANLAGDFKAAGYTNYVVGTVEADPSLEDVIEEVKGTGAKKVVLIPLMIVAGDHANNDMAGDGENSWKSRFKAAGYEVECVMKGLGEYEQIQTLFVKRAQLAMTYL